MRQGGPNGRRPQRGRHHGGGDNRNNSNGNGGNGGGRDNFSTNRPRSASSLRHQSFDSNCGDLRVRGNAWQVYEKYQALARDAASSGDRVTAENYLQHAEHYFRIIEAINEATVAEQPQREQPAYAQQPDIPPHYYPQNNQQPASHGDPNGNRAPVHAEQPPQAEATVQQRHAPPPAFFTPEEVEEHHGLQPMAAAR